MFTREVHADDEVGGVTSGGQYASPLTGLVDGCEVAGRLGQVTSLARLHPDLCQTECASLINYVVSTGIFVPCITIITMS